MDGFEVGPHKMFSINHVHLYTCFLKIEILPDLAVPIAPHKSATGGFLCVGGIVFWEKNKKL